MPEHRPDVSVKDFGAVGDGQTDDTAAIKRALNEARGKVIAFPRGRYVVTDIIKIRDSGTVLQGAGSQQTVIYVPKPLEKIRSNMGATTSGRPTSHGCPTVSGTATATARGTTASSWAEPTNC